MTEIKQSNTRMILLNYLILLKWLCRMLKRWWQYCKQF